MTTKQTEATPPQTNDDSIEEPRPDVERQLAFIEIDDVNDDEDDGLWATFIKTSTTFHYEDCVIEFSDGGHI